MGIVNSIILGIVQGLTEFLPVSSSGHLVVFQKLLGIAEHNLSFDIAAHLGTLLAIITVYRKSLKKVLVGVLLYLRDKNSTAATHLFLMVGIASIPTALMGFLLKDLFETLFSNISAVGVAFFVTALALLVAEVRSPGNSTSTDLNEIEPIRKMKWWQALIIGVVQGFAITPGISRSGSTISAALLLKVDRNTAALFSFILSIPAVLGAALLQFKDIEVWETSFLLDLGIGFVVSYLAGLAGLSGILYVVRQRKLKYFSLYLFGLSLICLFYLN